MQLSDRLSDAEVSVVPVREVPLASIEALLTRFGLTLEVEAVDAPITGSFWGGSEAGIVGHTVYVRPDTPVHSLLHEACHIICMPAERRWCLDRDAGGDDLEEAGVCYLQILLADEIEGVGRGQLMRDMDAWGYSFRLGDTRSWFEHDAEDARKWLTDAGLLRENGAPTFRLRA